MKHIKYDTKYKPKCDMEQQCFDKKMILIFIQIYFPQFLQNFQYFPELGLADITLQFGAQVPMISSGCPSVSTEVTTSEAQQKLIPSIPWPR